MTTQCSLYRNVLVGVLVLNIISGQVCLADTLRPDSGRMRLVVKKLEKNADFRKMATAQLGEEGVEKIMDFAHTQPAAARMAKESEMTYPDTPNLTPQELIDNMKFLQAKAKDHDRESQFRKYVPYLSDDAVYVDQVSYSREWMSLANYYNYYSVKNRAFLLMIYGMAFDIMKTLTNPENVNKSQELEDEFNKLVKSYNKKFASTPIKPKYFFSRVLSVFMDNRVFMDLYGALEHTSLAGDDEFGSLIVLKHGNHFKHLHVDLQEGLLKLNRDPDTYVLGAVDLIDSEDFVVSFPYLRRIYARLTSHGDVTSRGLRELLQRSIASYLTGMLTVNLDPSQYDLLGDANPEITAFLTENSDTLIGLLLNQLRKDQRQKMSLHAAGYGFFHDFYKTAKKRKAGEIVEDILLRPERHSRFFQKGTDFRDTYSSALSVLIHFSNQSRDRIQTDEDLVQRNGNRLMKMGFPELAEQYNKAAARMAEADKVLEELGDGVKTFHVVQGRGEDAPEHFEAKLSATTLRGYLPDYEAHPYMDVFYLRRLDTTSMERFRVYGDKDDVLYALNDIGAEDPHTGRILNPDNEYDRSLLLMEPVLQVIELMRHKIEEKLLHVEVASNHYLVRRNGSAWSIEAPALFDSGVEGPIRPLTGIFQMYDVETEPFLSQIPEVKRFTSAENPDDAGHSNEPGARLAVDLSPKELNFSIQGKRFLTFASWYIADRILIDRSQADFGIVRFYPKSIPHPSSSYLEAKITAGKKGEKIVLAYIEKGNEISKIEQTLDKRRRYSLPTLNFSEPGRQFSDLVAGIEILNRKGRLRTTNDIAKLLEILTQRVPSLSQTVNQQVILVGGLRFRVERRIQNRDTPVRLVKDGDLASHYAMLYEELNPTNRVFFEVLGPKHMRTRGRKSQELQSMIVERDKRPGYEVHQLKAMTEFYRNAGKRRLDVLKRSDLESGQRYVADLARGMRITIRTESDLFSRLHWLSPFRYELTSKVKGQEPNLPAYLVDSGLLESYNSELPGSIEDILESKDKLISIPKVDGWNEPQYLADIQEGRHEYFHKIGDIKDGNKTVHVYRRIDQKDRITAIHFSDDKSTYEVEGINIAGKPLVFESNYLHLSALLFMLQNSGDLGIDVSQLNDLTPHDIEEFTRIRQAKLPLTLDHHPKDKSRWIATDYEVVSWKITPNEDFHNAVKRAKSKLHEAKERLVSSLVMEGARLVTAEKIIGAGAMADRYNREGARFAWPANAAIKTADRTPMVAKAEVHDVLSFAEIARQDSTLSKLLLTLASKLGIKTTPMEYYFSEEELGGQLSGNAKEDYLFLFKQSAQEIERLGLGPVRFREDGITHDSSLTQVMFWGEKFRDKLPDDIKAHMPFKDALFLPKSRVVYTNIVLNADPHDPIQMEYATHLARIFTQNLITVTPRVQASLMNYDPAANYVLLAIRGLMTVRDFLRVKLSVEKLIERTARVSA